MSNYDYYGHDHWNYFLGSPHNVAINVCEKSHKNSKTYSNNGEKMDKYSFTVTDPDQVDVNRIVQENPEAKIIAVSLPDSPSVLVLIRKSLAERFTPEDGLHIGGDLVYSHMPTKYQYDKVVNQWSVLFKTLPSHYSNQSVYSTCPSGWFCVNAHQPKVFEQIEQALNFQKKSVTVRTW